MDGEEAAQPTTVEPQKNQKERIVLIRRLRSVSISRHGHFLDTNTNERKMQCTGFWPVQRESGILELPLPLGESPD